jgi:hypothetical protein
MRLLTGLFGALFLCLPSTAAPRETRNIILVTADGLRWQDLFGGMDPVLKGEKKAGMDDAAALKAKLWRPTPEARREALMPFFWTTLAPWRSSRALDAGGPAPSGARFVVRKQHAGAPGSQALDSTSFTLFAALLEYNVPLRSDQFTLYRRLIGCRGALDATSRCGSVLYFRAGLLFRGASANDL